MKTRTMTIETGKTCRLDAEVFGLTVEGPAVILIIETASVEPNSTESCSNPELNKNMLI
ncbi:hypothetical protein NST48_14345 [Paenibacillus sp. FSL M7-0547]|uniref:hypothetical protein n=1 Tax=Paenibacillus sp. FSL M7-0547 TaxID=2954755 RepID=UPI0030FAD3FD